MAGGQAIVDRVLLQLAPLQVRARAMFGGHCVYCDDKVVALVCDEQLFVKRTASTVKRTASIVKWQSRLNSAPPYPGAKPCLLIPEKLLMDRTQLRRLVQDTADALPVPKPRRTTLRAKRAKK